MNLLADASDRAPDAAPAALRSRRERLVQTLWFEGVGLLVVSPLLSLAAGTDAAESIGVLAGLSLAMMLWAAVYNTAFDRIEWRLARRVASDRPHRWRVLHAIGFELSAAGVTCPLLVAWTPLGWLQALAVDIGLGLAYAAYGYLFAIVFDRLRPVGSRR